MHNFERRLRNQRLIFTFYRVPRNGKTLHLLTILCPLKRGVKSCRELFSKYWLLSFVLWPFGLQYFQEGLNTRHWVFTHQLNSNLHHLQNIPLLQELAIL